ncbi:MAG: VCBS repeat-containing protein [candidate division WOR-3 bacterium]
MIKIYLILSLIPYGNSPSWEGCSGYYSTGGGFADINKDSYLDFIVSNGNDMQREKNAIHFNINGIIEINPSWLSFDSEYSGHLSINDFNNDGYIDFAVSNYLGPGGFSSPGNVLIYKNLNGNVNPNPFWKSKDSTYNFSCDFGDVDGDGYAEIAIAGGERYTNKKEYIKIYKNNGGVIDTLPYFKSHYKYYAYDVLFYDINKDNYLDLVVACDGEKNLIFFNYNGELETIPSWSSIDSEGSIQVDAGDIDNNGFPDLIFANNGQLPPYSSNLKIYLNQNGFPNTNPDYILDQSKHYYSTVSLCDIDYDGDLDIGGGGWWEPLVIFENFGGFFHSSPDWQWSPPNPQNLVCEKVTFTEIDKIWILKEDTFIRGENMPVYTLKFRNLCEIENVIKIDSGINLIIPINFYTYSLESGWISINKNITQNYDTFLIKYKISSSYDISITNWEESRGNFYFLSNLQNITEKYEKFENKERKCIIVYKGFKKEIFDLSGKRNKYLKNGIGFIRDKAGKTKVIILQ